MAVRFSMGTPTIESRPKKTRQGNQQERSCLQRVEIRQRKNIEVKVDEHINY